MTPLAHTLRRGSLREQCTPTADDPHHVAFSTYAFLKALTYEVLPIGPNLLGIWLFEVWRERRSVGAAWRMAGAPPLAETRSISVEASSRSSSRWCIAERKASRLACEQPVVTMCGGSRHSAVTTRFCTARQTCRKVAASLTACPWRGDEAHHGEAA